MLNKIKNLIVGVLILVAAVEVAILFGGVTVYASPMSIGDSINMCEPPNFCAANCGVEGQACNGWTDYCCTLGGGAYHHTCVGGVWDSGDWCEQGNAVCSTEGNGGKCKKPIAII